MLDALDKYKFGILAAIGVYIVVFLYANLATVPEYYAIEGYVMTGELMAEEEIQLKPENVEVPDNYEGDVLNMGDNVDDNRERSEQEYFENKSQAEIAQDVRDLEAQMRNDAGGADDRARIQEMIDARKEEMRRRDDAKEDGPKATDGGDTKAAPPTMVSWSLKGRDAFQGNKWYVRNPGYGCDNRSKVTVVINVKVNKSGNVTAATYDASQSSGASSCEIDKALKYAKMSRFEYQASGGETGWIKYIFMPQ